MPFRELTIDRACPRSCASAAEGPIIQLIMARGSRMRGPFEIRMVVFHSLVATLPSSHSIFLSVAKLFFLSHSTPPSGLPQANLAPAREGHNVPRERLAIPAGHPRILKTPAFRRCPHCPRNTHLPLILPRSPRTGARS